MSKKMLLLDAKYNLGREEYLEECLEELRAKKAEAKKALNAMFAGCTPEDFPVLRRKEASEE